MDLATLLSLYVFPEMN